MTVGLLHAVHSAIRLLASFFLGPFDLCWCWLLFAVPRDRTSAVVVSDFGGCETRLNSVFIVLRPDVLEIIRERVDRLTILVGGGVVGGSVVVGVGFDVGHVRIGVGCCWRCRGVEPRRGC